MIVACGVSPSAGALLAAGIGERVHLVLDVAGLLRALQSPRDVALVVLGPELTGEQVRRYTGRLRGERPEAVVVAVGPPMNRLERHQLLEAGVSAVLPAADLHAAGRSCREFLAARSSGGAGQIVTVFAGKGGCGTTTVATNLAIALAGTPGRRVGLVDLDLRSGDVAVTLGLTAERTLVPGPVDGAALDAMLTPYRPGLDCLLAPVHPGVAERLEADEVGPLFAELASRFDVVVVDTPAAFSGPVVAALDRSDHHVLVTTAERPALQRLRETLDVMDALGHRRDSRSILVNRTHAFVGITPEDVEGLLHQPVAGYIPWSPDVAGSINRRAPLTQTRPDHPVSAAIRRFAESRLTRAGAVPLPRSGAP